MKIMWHEVEDSRHMPAAGHGIEFYHKDYGKARQLVAFLEGFDWYHGKPGPSHVYILNANALDREVALTDREGIVQETKRAIIDYLAREERTLCGEISDKISIHANA